MGNTLESFEFLQLPPELIIAVLKNCDFHQCYKVRLTCKYLNNLIEENKKSLASNEYDFIALDRRHVRAWRKMSPCRSWLCDQFQIPIEHITKFFCFVNVNVLAVSNLDEEMCAFLTEQVKNKKFELKQLCLSYSFSASHESICQLLKVAKCRVVYFRHVESKLTLAHFEMEQFKNLESLCIKTDASIGEEFFDSILSVCNAKKFLFHRCDRLPQRFVRDMFEKWLNGSRELEAVTIVTKQNFNFDEIISGLSIQNVNPSTWTMKNVKGEEAIITMYCGEHLYFYVGFKVNNHDVEEIFCLYLV